MEPLEIVVAPTAQRDLKNLDRRTLRRVLSRIKDLGLTPRPHGVEKLQANPAFLRVRVGNHRIVYHVFQERLVVILLIRDRKEVYRGIGDLDSRLNSALSEKKAPSEPALRITALRK